VSLNFNGIFQFLVLSVSGLFIYLYLDTEKIFSLYGIYVFSIYCVLSLVSGIRYKNIIFFTSGKTVKWIDVFRVPAAMNLASYLFPVKGGGVSSEKSIFLAVFNLIFLLYLFIFILFVTSFKLDVTNFKVFAFFIGYPILLYCLSVFASKVSDYSVRWEFGIIDMILVVFHFCILSGLCYLLVGPISVELSFFLALFLLVSALLKLTPGNIGVLEGGAILAAQVLPDYGEIFPPLVAAYRSLSILHALIAGAPSMISLALKRKNHEHS